MYAIFLHFAIISFVFCFVLKINRTFAPHSNNQRICNRKIQNKLAI